ncbi:MAG: DUF167 domain-containing protein [Actinomycetota bacterium]|nr:DUF167 domain-containing protein [Actinomycetota bacterium]
MAEAFGVRRGDVAIVVGERGRDKVVEVDVDSEVGKGILAGLM